MINIRSKFNELYNRGMQKFSNTLFREVLKTEPIPVNPAAETIVYCALDRSSCRQYIAAVKSLVRYQSDLAVIAQSDGTLDSRNIDEIKTHLPGARVMSQDEMFQGILDFADPALLQLIPPFDEYHRHSSVKIMYLKFLNVICQFNGRKVIIIDSDLLFLRKPDYILDWAFQPYTRDFYGEGSNARAGDFHAMGFNFKDLDVANFSSGTLGVGGSVSLQELKDMFAKVRAYDPSLFYAWEIEQALWSIVLATRSNPVNIDNLRDVYVGSGWRSYRELKDKAVIAHFAGAVRFNGFRYIRCAKDVFRELLQESR